MNSIDTRNMRNILREFMQELDSYLDKEPENYRRLMRYSRFSFGMGPDYNDRGQALLYLLKNSWECSESTGQDLLMCTALAAVDASML